MHSIKISKLVLLEVAPVLVPVHLVEAALVLGVVDVDFSRLEGNPAVNYKAKKSPKARHICRTLVGSITYILAFPLGLAHKCTQMGTT